jgi:L-ribulose-5-phosphate 3-epimerase
MSCSDYIVNTYSFTRQGAFEALLDPVAKAGFEGFEVMMYPGHLWPSEMTPGSVRHLRDALSSRGLSIASFNQPQIDINLAAATPEMRQYSIDIHRGIIDLAGKLGVPAIQIGPGKVNHFMPSPRDESLERFFGSLHALLPAAQAAGTQLLIENMPHSFIPDAAGVVDAIERFGANEIGITYDVANGAFIGEDIGAALRLCGSKLRMIHVSDTTRESFAHDPVGHGTIDFRKVLTELSLSSWRGKPVLEIVSSAQSPIDDIVSSAEELDRMWPRQ